MTDTSEPLEWPPRMIREAEAAKYLEVSLRTLQRWRAAASGPTYFRFGPRSIRYAAADLEAWRANAQRR